MQLVGKTQENLIKNLEALMSRRGWKPKDVADATGLSLQWVYNTIKGERFPGPDNLDRLAEAFNTTVSKLLSGDDQSTAGISPLDALNALKRFVDNNSNQQKTPTKQPKIEEIVSLLSSLDDPDLLSEVVDSVKSALRGAGKLPLEGAQGEVQKRKSLRK